MNGVCQKCSLGHDNMTRKATTKKDSLDISARVFVQPIFWHDGITAARFQEATVAGGNFKGERGVDLCDPIDVLGYDGHENCRDDLERYLTADQADLKCGDGVTVHSKCERSLTPLRSPQTQCH